jgi:hypothetical protein
MSSSGEADGARTISMKVEEEAASEGPRGFGRVWCGGKIHPAPALPDGVQPSEVAFHGEYLTIHPGPGS